jgi:hypothetical protein
MPNSLLEARQTWPADVARVIGQLEGEIENMKSTMSATKHEIQRLTAAIEWLLLQGRGGHLRN